MASKVFRDDHPTGGVVLQRDRYRIGFKTDAQMRSEGWQPVRVWPFVRRFMQGMGAIALALLALHIVGRLGGLQ